MMIKLTTIMGREPVYVDPFRIAAIEQEAGGEYNGKITPRCTRIVLNCGRLVIVEQETEEVYMLMQAAKRRV